MAISRGALDMFSKAPLAVLLHHLPSINPLGREKPAMLLLVKVLQHLQSL